MTRGRYRQAYDEDAVRRIWPAGLLANTRDPTLGYPPALIKEEEEFVAECMESGDMSDLEAEYQSAAATGFWVVTAEQQQGSRDGGLSKQEAEVIGMVGLRAASRKGSGDSQSTAAVVSRFGVDAAHRGRGAGRMLLAALEEHAWAHGFSRVSATTVSLNAPALAVYAACGYREVYRGRQDGRDVSHGEPPFVRVEKQRRGGGGNGGGAMEQAPAPAPVGSQRDEGDAAGPSVPLLAPTVPAVAQLWPESEEPWPAEPPTTRLGSVCKGKIYAAAFSPDGSHLMVGSDDQAAPAVVLETREWSVVRVLRNHRCYVKSVAWSPDGELCAMGSGDHSASVVAVGSWSIEFADTVYTDAVFSVAWSPHSDMLAVGSADQSVSVLQRGERHSPPCSTDKTAPPN
jgi:GNAT superfamily N-acetyltransferase